MPHVPPAWLTGALVAVTVVHLALLLVVLRTGRFGGGESVDPSVYRHEAGLECPTCGERNDEEYRFCRHCVGQLPSGSGIGAGGTTPDGRRTL